MVKRMFVAIFLGLFILINQVSADETKIIPVHASKLVGKVISFRYGTTETWHCQIIEAIRFSRYFSLSITDGIDFHGGKIKNIEYREDGNQWWLVSESQDTTVEVLSIEPVFGTSVGSDLLKYPKFMVGKTLTWEEHNRSSSYSSPARNYLITAVSESQQAQALVINVYFPEELYGDFVSYNNLSGKFKWWINYQETETKDGAQITVKKSEELFRARVE